MSEHTPPPEHRQVHGGSPEPFVSPEVTDPKDRIVLLREGFEIWADEADSRRHVVDPIDDPDLRVRFKDLHELLEDVIDRNPDRSVELLTVLMGSGDVTTRFMAVSQFDVAYFADPEGARGLFTGALTDDDPRVVTYAHEMLQMFGSDNRFGERDDADERGMISLDFIASLPIHEMSARVTADGREVALTPADPWPWWPLGEGVEDGVRLGGGSALDGEGADA